jgi:hypothetical protein
VSFGGNRNCCKVYILVCTYYVPEIVLLQTHYSEIQQLLYTKNIPQTPQIYCFQKHIYRVYNTYYYYPIIYTTLIIPISYPSQFPQWHKLVSTPEAVVGAHAQSLVEAVILNTLFTTFTFYSQFFFLGACRLTQTPTSKWCGLKVGSIKMCVNSSKAAPIVRQPSGAISSLEVHSME